jgi:hypothetical protein
VRKLFATMTIATLATIGAVGAAGTVGAQGEQVCPNLDTGHLSANNQTSFTFTAPEGQLIVQVCVKAGSSNQGDGPEFIDFPGVTSATFSHSSGKEISHFSVKFGEAPPPPNGTTPTTAAPPTTAAAPGAPAAAAVVARPVFTG